MLESSTLLRTPLLAALCLGAGCFPAEPVRDGEAPEEGKASGAVSATDGPLLPLKVGNTWTYRVIGDTAQSEKVVTVEAQEQVGGDGPHQDKTAFRIVSIKDEKDKTVNWWAVVNKRAVRYREQGYSAKTGQVNSEEHYEPSKLIIDGTADHTKKGASWEVAYIEAKSKDGMEPVITDKTEVWTVDAVEQTVKVPAGTFKALVVQRADGGKPKTYWFVKGIGKVKETGGDTEELVSYEVSP